MGGPQGRPRGPKTKPDQAEKFETENGFEHLFTGDYAYLYDEICKRAKDNVRTPLQELIAIVKRAVDISKINDATQKRT